MDYIKVALVITPQFIAGCLLYLLLLKRAEVGLVELLSIGGVLGIISNTIIDQIFVNLQLPRIGWLVSISIIVVAFELCRRRKTIVFATILWRSEFTKSILPIFAISAMALGTEWFWLFPSGVLFVIAAFFSVTPPRKYSRSAIRVANLAAIAAGIFMIANRPKIWWFLYDSDYAFQQSLARSIAQWGISDYLLLSGTRTKYHWFSYAWIGLVDRSANATMFFVYTRVAPIVFLFLITGIIWTIINRSSLSKLRTYTSTFIVMTASSYALWGYGTKITFLASPSQFYAFAFLMASVFLLLEASVNKIRFPIILIPVISSTTILSKTMHGAILVAALLTTLIIHLIHKSKLSRTIFLTCIISILGALITYSFFVANSEAETVFEVRFSDFFWQLQGDARLLPERQIDLIGFLTVISFAILPLFLTLLNFLHSKFEGFRLIDSLSIGSLAAGIGLSLVILAAFGENLYFLHASIVFSSVLGFATICSYKQIICTKPSTFIILIVLGISLCVLSYLIPNINSGAQTAIVIRSMRIYTSSWILIIFALMLLIVNLIRQKSSFQAIFKLVVVTSSMVVSFSFVNWFDTMPRKHNEFFQIGETYLGTTELKNLADWMNTYSDENEILASNFGWPTIAEGELSSFSAPCPMYREKNYFENCQRTNNALLIAYVHRRTWLQVTATHYTGFTPEIDSRQAATLGFAADPTSAQLQQMLNDGVDWFVIDRSTTGRTSWEPFATMRFENDSFFVLKLNTAS